MQALARVPTPASLPSSAAQLTELVTGIARDLALYDEADETDCARALGFVRQLNQHLPESECRRRLSELIRRALVSGYLVVRVK